MSIWIVLKLSFSLFDNLTVALQTEQTATSVRAAQWTSAWHCCLTAERFLVQFPFLCGVCMFSQCTCRSHVSMNGCTCWRPIQVCRPHTSWQLVQAPPPWLTFFPSKFSEPSPHWWTRRNERWLFSKASCNVLISKHPGSCALCSITQAPVLCHHPHV